MKKLLVFILVLSATSLFNRIVSQDRIVLRSGDEIKCAVKEIGTTEIKYIQEEVSPDVIFSVNKKDVEKVIFADGKLFEINQENELLETVEQNSKDLFLIQKKNALKIDFISPVNNVLSLTYERCLQPGSTVEFSIGAVGIGIAKKEDNASGILFRGGYKLIRSPDHYIKGMRYAHILKGLYSKFEFDFASYRIEGYKELFGEREEYTLTKWAILLVLGSQYVFNDNFVIDTYTGIGFGRNNLEELDWTFPYGFATLDKSMPLAFSLGVRLGFLIK